MSSHKLLKDFRLYLAEANVLDLSKKLDAGFCEFNPVINQYAQYSPDNLAEMLIFVIATQQMRWYDVVPKFPILMKFVKDNDGLLNPDTATTDEMGKTRYEIPKAFAQLTLGFRKNAIEQIWKQREAIYSRLNPLFAKYNNGGSLEKEEAVFYIYLEFMTLPGLGLPKAAFAVQLIIGRLGCIDSINLNLYKSLDPNGELIKFDKAGTPSFKRPGSSVKGGVVTMTKGGIRLAEKYIEFLKQIANVTKSSELEISQQLWDSWVELVSLKINKTGDIDVIMPDGEKFIVPNDYSKNVKDADTKPSAAFRKKYIGNITGRDVSRQHFPLEMYENLHKWSNYIFKLIKG